MGVFDYVDWQTAQQDSEGVSVTVRWVWHGDQPTDEMQICCARAWEWCQDGQALRKYPKSQLHQVSNVVRCPERRGLETDDFGKRVIVWSRMQEDPHRVTQFGPST